MLEIRYFYITRRVSESKPKERGEPYDDYFCQLESM